MRIHQPFHKRGNSFPHAEEAGTGSRNILQFPSRARDSIVAAWSDSPDERGAEDIDSKNTGDPVSGRNSEFVLIQFCESDQAALRALTNNAYRECLIRHVKMARQIGVIPILVAPVRMRAYTPAGQKRQPLFPYAVAMRDAAAQIEVSFVDLKARCGSHLELVGRELGNQLHNSSRCLIFYNELGVKRLLSWWYARADDPCGYRLLTMR